MPTERVVEVAVQCGSCDGSGRRYPHCPYCADSTHDHFCPEPVPCDLCSGTGKTTRTATLAPSSLAAAMLTLAEAVDYYYGSGDGRETVDAALAAYRQHPDYRRPE